MIENLGATLDQFDTIDLTDNEIRKLDGFPLLQRLSTLLLRYFSDRESSIGFDGILHRYYATPPFPFPPRSNNKVCRIADSLEVVLPKLRTLILTNNVVAELGDLDALASVATLETLCLLRNPVTTKKNYRYYVVHRLPQLR